MLDRYNTVLDELFSEQEIYLITCDWSGRPAPNARPITDLSLERIHHPYDGGADVLLPTTAERDALIQRHTDWLSRHPNGF